MNGGPFEYSPEHADNGKNFQQAMFHVNAQTQTYHPTALFWYVVFEREAREFQLFSHFHIFMFQLRHKNITHIAHSCHKEITRKATLECKCDYDEN
jgi:hypothetical protein